MKGSKGEPADSYLETPITTGKGIAHFPRLRVYKFFE